jgi:hypothetical protein
MTPARGAQDTVLATVRLPTDLRRSQGLAETDGATAASGFTPLDREIVILRVDCGEEMVHRREVHAPSVCFQPLYLPVVALSDDDPFIVLTETKFSFRCIPVGIGTLLAGLGSTKKNTCDSVLTMTSTVPW